LGAACREDEYESYVWPLYKLLIDGAPRAEIEAYLRWVADAYITLSVPEDKVRLVVDKLLALNIAATRGVDI
jgi:hypothetical protein